MMKSKNNGQSTNTKSLKQSLEKQYIKGQSIENYLNINNIEKLYNNTNPKGFDFLQNFCYKVYPCPNGSNCINCPRTGPVKNQYYENELQCPFYHHDKDRRRFVLGDHNHSDFKYKASFKASKENPSENAASLNWFESLYHPMFYKIYECKRHHCQGSAYCPFYHDVQEKTRFEEFFGRVMPKLRVYYSKDKKSGSDQNSSEFIPLTEKQSQRNYGTPERLPVTQASTPISYSENKKSNEHYFEFETLGKRIQNLELSPSSNSTRKSSNDSEEGICEKSPKSDKSEEGRFVSNSGSVDKKVEEIALYNIYDTRDNFLNRLEQVFSAIKVF